MNPVLAPRWRRSGSWFMASILAVHFAAALHAGTRIETVRTPGDGLQPQALIDSKGTVHVVYFKGSPAGGNLFYARQEPGQPSFSTPLPVNHRTNDAIAVGTIRGAQMALGRNGRVHVAWNGNKSLADGKHPGVPMWYARLNDAQSAFEPERDVMTFTGGLDGGGTVAADDQGNVYVMWHGAAPGNTRGEAGRAVYIARSKDDGETFAPERPASPEASGACACCGMRAMADHAGQVFALYRGAAEVVNRDEILLVSRDHGATFAKTYAHPWNVAACPMSSASLAYDGQRVLAAWETAGQVYFTHADPKTLTVATAVAPPVGGPGKRKHPTAVANAAGEVLLAWTEGTGWQKGGALAWQLFDRNGRPTENQGRIADAIPVWGLVAAVARPDGSFLILH